MYKIIKALALAYFKLFFKVRVTGAENIPKEGKAVLVSNHISNYDPVVVGIYIDRIPRFMAKKELFEIFGLKHFFLALKAFPVDRGRADLASYKQATNILKSGEILGIFAEGTRVREDDAVAAKAGAALFAAKNNAPVIPVGVSSKYKLFSKVYVNYGKPISMEEYQGVRLNNSVLKEITDKIMGEIEKLKVEVK